MNWLLLSIITIISWGIMGLIVKLATKHTYTIIFAAALIIHHHPNTHPTPSSLPPLYTTPRQTHPQKT